MSTAVLSIGSNLGDRLAALQSVLQGLGPRVRAVSAVYETEPWGGVEQDRFLNAVVVAVDDGLDPLGWLELGQSLENAAGRVREVHWGPRTLDVDVITVDDGEPLRCHTDRLTLPHPLAQDRAFVLVPWLDADPDAVLPIAGGTVAVAELVAALDERDRAAVRRTAEKLHRCG